MEYLSVIAAGIAAFAFGAVWYMSLSKPWMEAAGVSEEQAHNAGAVTYLTGLISAILVAGMMRHVFVGTGVDSLGKGVISGLGLGLFIATPWIATNYGFAGRPMKLLLIDGGYATIGCGVIGLVLMLF
ncbi:DUF1761 domain-containing protein [Amylibacter sp. SFDW26]|uniref:DUF1761 domain-containing protein n=1 Tax=Amylibacter sp. SFDW26 TaxID=2652722 RepID=UPI001262159D|nr:DUF1761 domain-containing protein [Amylibacter sp. SFDW26]KAB7614635.1 DUF1761 domain-containing protein [Amylibacter sp. SFDW26]